MKIWGFDMSTKLPPKREKFAQLVASGQTYAEAHREAFPASRKWKMESVWVESSKLMSNPKVLQRVEELQEEYKDKLIKSKKVDLEEILTKMSSAVRLDKRQYYDKEGNFKNMHDLTEDQAMCLQEIKTQEIYAGKEGEKVAIGRIVHIKSIDIKSLWDMFLKHFGAYMNEVEQSNETLQHIKDIIEAAKK